MKNIALILASGTGSRCGLGYPKQFAKINDKTILEHTINVFETHDLINEIIIVTNEEYLDKVKDLISYSKKVTAVIKGGETRKDSSYNGVFKITDLEANVLIHDAVRPFVKQDVITECINKLEKYNAVCVTTPTTDTIFVVDENNIIKKIPQRKTLKCAQTPQCFKLSLIKQAHELAKQDENCSVTDDCGLIINYTDEPIVTIDGNVDNIKITYQKDLAL